MRQGMIKYSEDPIGASIQERVNDGSKVNMVTNAKCIQKISNPLKLELKGTGVPRDHLST